MTVDQLRAHTRAELETRQAEIETVYSLQFTEADLIQLASGFVPSAVKAMAIAALDWHAEDQRRADRPSLVAALKLLAKQEAERLEKTTKRKKKI